MKYYLSLDGLRGVAVGIVLLAHAGVPGIRSGGAGVDIFFTLSGFLISSILLAELDRFRSIRLHHFYIRRFLRLLPCLWLTLAAVLIVWGAAGRLDAVLRDVICSGTYTINWFRAAGQFGRGPLSHAWTLAIEEQYYLLWPLVLGVLCRNPNRRMAQGGCLLAAALVVVVYRCAMLDVFSRDRIHYGLDTHADPLLIGSALACFLSAQSREMPLSVSRALGWLIAPLAAVGIVVVVTTWAWGEGGVALMIGYPVVGIATALILLDCVAGEHSLLRAALEWLVLVWVGRISYGIYLVHLPIFLGLRSIGLNNWPYLIALGVPATLGVSALSYYGVERYCLRLKRYFAPGARSSGTGADLPEPSSTAESAKVLSALVRTGSRASRMAAGSVKVRPSA